MTVGVDWRSDYPVFVGEADYPLFVLQLPTSLPTSFRLHTSPVSHQAATQLKSIVMILSTMKKCRKTAELGGTPRAK